MFGHPSFGWRQFVEARRLGAIVSSPPERSGQSTKEQDVLGGGSALEQVNALREELRQSDERYQQLLTSIDLIVWEAEADPLKFYSVSSQAEAMLGYPCSRWLNEPEFWQEHLHPDDRDGALEFCQRSTREGRDHTFEYRMIASDGRHVWIHDVVRFAVDPVRGAILRGTMTDVTLRKNSQAELRTTEERFQRFVETLSEVVYALDSEGKFIYCSPSIKNMSSYTAQEVVGRPFIDFVDPEDLAAVGERYSQVLLGQSMEAEYRVLDKCGARRWVSASIAPTMDNGVVIGLTGVFRDITERRQVAVALAESEARYRELVEMSPDAIVVHQGGQIIFANRAALTLVGATMVHQLVGRSPLDLVHESSRPMAIARIRRMIEIGEPENRVEEQLVRLDGTTLDAEVLASPIMMHGAPAILVVVHDITDGKRAQTEIQKLNEELELRVQDRTARLVAANSELEAFSYSVSHDLRAPLRVIEGFSRMFLDEFATTLDTRGLEYLQRIHSTSVRMEELIHDLLAFSRMSRTAVTLVNVDLGDLARSTVRRLVERDPQRRAKVVIAKNMFVRGDEQLLQIAIENLIENAWKYSSTREIAEVEFGVEQGVDGPVYFVRDNGVGFDMRFIDKLFRPFQRLHPVGEFDGTGIGLATVRRVVERHGGAVWAEGEVDRGTTLRFTLPTPEGL